MKVFASYNIKGGVGKTASAVNLAYLSARSGARTLIWDLDPQGAASFYFRVKPRIKGGAKRLFAKKRHGVRKAIRGTDYDGLDLLPADFSNRHLDALLDREKKPTKSFKRLLKTLYKDYDHVFVDCAPSIGTASECVFEISDVLLVPSIPTTLSVNTLEQLGRHLRKSTRRPPRVLPFFSMVDKRKSLHKAVMKDAMRLPFDILETTIPYSSTIERMGIERAPVHAYAAKSRPAADYEHLFREITTAA